MSFRRTLFAVCLAASALSASAQERVAGQSPFALADGERIVFLGDSITQGGTYVVYLDAYVRTRFPDVSVEMINHGLSSETINGMSEADHPSPRPWIHDRLERDALAWKPDAISICYGMNDGNYYPPPGTPGRPEGDERFAKYQAGYARFFERVAAAGDPRVYVLTPAPFDAYRRKAGDENAVDYGYKFPAVDYDRTLGTYTDWLLALSRPRTKVVDLHGPMNAWLTQRRIGQVGYTFSPDAVHPDATGHLLMALPILEGWNAPDVLAHVRLAASASDSSARAEASLPLPMPRDARWDEKAVALCGWAEKTQTVVIDADVADGQWKLTLAGHPRGADVAEEATLYEGVVTGAQLREGVRLNADEWQALAETRARFLADLTKRHGAVYQKWRAEIAAGRDGTASIAGEELAQLDAELARDAQPWEIVVKATAE